MKIHEYQAKALFRRYDIPTLRSEVASDSGGAELAARTLGGASWAVKAQIHAGGRGKGGGIKLCRSLDEVRQHSAAILSKPLVTPQTGPEGKTVLKLLIEEACEIQREMYLSAILDRSSSSIVVMASSEGGVEIEEVAKSQPEKILTVHVDAATGASAYQARTLAFGLGIPRATHAAFGELVRGVVRLFVEGDCSLVEINPLVLTSSGKWIALDAKVTFDDNALFRHPEYRELADPSEEDPRDLEAAKWNLNYIHLDGNIGCMVNGAGLAMATMDIIKLAGGEPANFLDVGGGASAEMVREAFKIIVSDPKVTAILINIFGGIMKCDVLAQGIVQAVNEVGLKVPLVVRLEGTNVDEGKRILREAKLSIETAADMAQAAARVVAAARLR